MAREVTVEVLATPERVYELVSDVTRMGEWSPECYRCEWTRGAGGPTAGATFKGYNRVGPFKWATDCVVEVAEPPREFSFVAGDEKEGKTRWVYRFDRSGPGTMVSESFETIVPAPMAIRVAERLVALGRSRDHELRKGMRRTLDRIKRAAEAPQRG